MRVPSRPRLRPVDVVPFRQNGEELFALRDPEGMADGILVMPHGDALLAMLMDGKRTLPQIRAEFQAEAGRSVSDVTLGNLIRQLDEAYLLEGERFEARRADVIGQFLKSPVRPASFAGSSYASEPGKLRKELSDYFSSPKGPGAIRAVSPGNGRAVCAVVSPHIDPYRGGPAYAHAFKRLAEECDADLFVILGTSHQPMENLFCVTRKDFETPLGCVKTDGEFINRLAEHLASSVAGQQIDLFADQWAHRGEHSIEFQAVFLKHVLGENRQFSIVPVLCGSLQPFLEDEDSPDESPELQSFLAAMRAAVDGHTGSVCYIAGADLAHIGQRFGDPWTTSGRRLRDQADDDRQLLDVACRSDSLGFFSHIARQHDRRRICGLAPIYTMLELIAPARGELLAYDQAVEPDGSSCVSFASLAFYR